MSSQSAFYCDKSDNDRKAGRQCVKKAGAFLLLDACVTISAGFSLWEGDQVSMPVHLAWQYSTMLLCCSSWGLGPSSPRLVQGT